MFKKHILPGILKILELKHQVGNADICCYGVVDCFTPGFPETIMYCIDQGDFLLFGQIIRRKQGWFFRKPVVLEHLFKNIDCSKRKDLLGKLGFNRSLLNERESTDLPSEERSCMRDSGGPWLFLRVGGFEKIWFEPEIFRSKLVTNSQVNFRKQVENVMGE